jgi:hypothetical protein
MGRLALIQPDNGIVSHGKCICGAVSCGAVIHDGEGEHAATRQHGGRDILTVCPEDDACPVADVSQWVFYAGAVYHLHQFTPL